MARQATKRDADATTPVRTVFLPAGSSSSMHLHEDDAAWLHVVSGAIVDERWTRDAEGGFVHEQRRLAGGQSMAAPGGAVHRVRAIDDTAFVTTCACDCNRARPVAARDVNALLRLSRTGVDREWAQATALGEPSPDVTSG